MGKKPYKFHGNRVNGFSMIADTLPDYVVGKTQKHAYSRNAFFSIIIRSIICQLESVIECRDPVSVFFAFLVPYNGPLKKYLSFCSKKSS